MNTSIQATQQEKKRKKRAMMFAFIINGAIVAALLFPFITSMMPDEADQTTYVEVDFTNFSSASAAPSKSASNKKKQTPKKVDQPIPKVEKLPAPKPILTAPVPEIPMPTSPKEVEAPVVPEEVVEETVVEEPVEATPEPEATEEAAETSSNSGNGTGEGEASADGDGKDLTPGEGDQGMDFSGEGIFGRKVTYRADIKHLTETQGKIVINLCVNQEGRVVYGEANEDLTTIERQDLVDKTVKATKRYRFERDYNAPKKQCGKMTFIFDLD